MISFNQCKASHFSSHIIYTIAKFFFVKRFVKVKFVIDGESKDRFISSPHDGFGFVMTISITFYTVQCISFIIKAR